jgi:glycosyltransferase involved in cell wall biosynthesis
MPLLTIGIPTFNGGFNFPELFESIKNLGLSDDLYEVLVVDNNSNDNTDEVIEGYKKTIPNLRYHKNSYNIGRVENWNKVIELTTGKYLIHMNVNDRFMKFDVKKYLDYLDQHSEVSLILTDILNVFNGFESTYPNWKESGKLKLKKYITKTFLETDFLEFHSLGVLHQHIFRTEYIKKHNICFDPALPRTTDRVFVGDVLNLNSDVFFYTNEVMVRWQINDSRFHNNIHLDYKKFDMNMLWLNEYNANLKIAQMGAIPFKDFLKGQIAWSKFYHYRYKMRLIQKWFGMKTGEIALEEVTAKLYSSYLYTQARLNDISMNSYEGSLKAVWKVLKMPLKKLGVVKEADRSLIDIIDMSKPI